MNATASGSLFSRNEFLIRRWHSLTGLIPIGAYMVVHLLVNASLLTGASTFQKNVYQIHSLEDFLVVVEWTFILLPILFHGLLGLWIIREGQPNSQAYPLSGNIRYTLQRATGILAFFFILYHVFHLHGWFHFEGWLRHVAEPLGGANFRPFSAASTLAVAMSSVAIQAVYAVGVLACVYHLANGIWTMGITWGVWTSPAAQRRATRLSVVLGTLLAILGLSALYAPSTIDVNEARAVEDRMYKAKVEAGDIKANDHKRWTKGAEQASQVRPNNPSSL